MQLVNAAQFLIIMFFLVFAAALAASAFDTVGVGLTRLYASLLQHNLELNIEVFTLKFNPRGSSFTSTQFFVLN